MGDGRLAAVLDTGPLIHLAEVGCLPLLEIFDELHVPEGVLQEAQRPASIRSELGRADRHTVLREEVEEFAAKSGLQKLQGAERESLLLCSKLGVELLLTDDLAVRQAAKALGLTPIGSLGVCVFRPKAATDSDARRPLIPTQGGHRFQSEGGRFCGCAGMAGRLGSDGWPPSIGIVVPV